MCKDDKYISLECDTFEALKEDFDKIMNDTLGNMEMKGAEDAVVTIKINVSLRKLRSETMRMTASVISQSQHSTILFPLFCRSSPSGLAP